MGMNSIAGSGVRVFFHGIDPEALRLWYAAAPVAAVLTPVCAYVCPRISLGYKRLLFSTFIIAEAIIVTGKVTITHSTLVFAAVTICLVWISVSGVILLGGSIRVSSRTS